MRPKRWFWGVVSVAVFLPAILAAMGTAAASEGEQTAAELIEQARRQTAQQEALSIYGKALEAKPDDAQRLEILFRMAQLNGCLFDWKKGERPNYSEAIRLYREIVDSYPPEEPMVLTSMGLISDHYTSLREFETALAWAKKVVEYNTSQMRERIKAIDEQTLAAQDDKTQSLEYQKAVVEAARLAHSMKQGLSQIERHREVAVDRVAASAGFIDPLRVHGELRAIAEKYAGTAVGERATQRLRESMDKWPDLWAPDDELPLGPAAAWQAAPPVPISLRRHSGGTEAPLDVGFNANNGLAANDPNATEKPEEDTPLVKAPRAPPSLLGILTTTGAAGLAVLGLAVLITKRRSS